MAIDPETIHQINAGDEKAFESIFRTYYSPLAWFALKYVSDQDIAEEVVQEVFTNIWIKSQSVVVETSIKSYLYGAVRNACLNYLKHQKIEQAYADRVKMTVSHGEAVDTLELDELKERIAVAMDRLPEKCREIFEMSRYDGKKYKEIAQELKLSQKTVENQMGKALKILREELGDYLPVVLWLISVYGGKI